MRFHEIVNEAKFRKPIVVFHGTSSKFLSSILKNGVVANPDRKVWDEDPDATSRSFSRASLGGSYWTTNLGVCKMSASNAKRKHGGNPLIVIAQVAEGSAVADEDNVDRAIIV